MINLSQKSFWARRTQYFRNNITDKAICSGPDAKTIANVGDKANTMPTNYSTREAYG
jgi:hypothetical protein